MDSSSGYKSFNATGGEDEVTTKILRPKADPAILIRRIAMVAIVVVLLGVIGVIALQKSHLSLNFSEPEGKETKFAAPQQTGD